MCPNGLLPLLYSFSWLGGGVTGTVISTSSRYVDILDTNSLHFLILEFNCLVCIAFYLGLIIHEHSLNTSERLTSDLCSCG